ncbi:MAG: rod shape-determining protein RodA [Bacteroidales bacterium]|nr:rod shape-determining protein RodA [Bacteroidales bacterium]MDY6347376.1 rod shape-determining protein RodA [Bacteroidales bacterium]
MPKLDNKITKGFDVRLIGYYLALVFIGWMTIYSTCCIQGVSLPVFDFSQLYGKQMIWIATSFVLATVILLVDGRIIQHYAYFLYLFCLFLMVLVLFIGAEINGAKSWIKIGTFSIQPTEFMKFATALTLAKFMQEGKTATQRRYMWIWQFLLIMIPVVVVMLQHDAGSALVFASFIILFYREGLSNEFIIFGIIAAILAIVTLFLNEIYAIGLASVAFIAIMVLGRLQRKKYVRNILLYALSIAFVFSVNLFYEKGFEPHQKQRIDTILGKTSDPLGADFNLNQSKIAIGSGGLFGKGYLKGTQTKLKFVPEQSTDFIFCAIGEEWGFFGTLVVFGLYGALIFRILKLSEKNRNPFVRYYGYGVAGVFIVHFFINIGMTTGILPIIGIPLPLISYGGSSLWAFTMMLFCFIKFNDN